MRGYALLMVLWAMVLLTAMAGAFVMSNRLTIAMTRNHKERVLSYTVALRGFDRTIGFILNDSDPAVDFIDSKGKLWLDTVNGPVPEQWTFEDGVAEVEVIPEDGKININLIRADQFRRLLKALGYESQRIDEMVDSLKDWIDPDDLHRLNGAEDEYYISKGYVAKNAPLDTLQELVLIKGFGKDVLGVNGKASLVRYLTVYGKEGMNINVASESIMRLMGLTEYDIREVLKTRTPDIKGLRAIPGSIVSKGFTRTASGVFTIRVSGRYRDADIGYNIESVVRRVYSSKGYRLEVLYWREDVSYSGVEN